MGYVLLLKYTIIKYLYGLLNVFENILDLCNVYFGNFKIILIFVIFYFIFIDYCNQNLLFILIYILNLSSFM